MRTGILAASGLFGLLAPTIHAGLTADFEDLGLPPGAYYNGADLAGGFLSRGIAFGNEFDDSFGFDYWSGFAASAVNAPSTPGYSNQYASAAGAGAGGSATYAIGFDDPYGAQRDVVSLATPATVAGLFVNNTAYAAWSMRQGDAFAKAFGGADGADPDWFRLAITGLGPGGQTLGTIDVYLADYRAADPALDSVMTQWTWVDLTALGNQVAGLSFALDSSDVGQFGMNTPAYFAIDNLVVVPEPSVFALAVFGACVGWLRHRRQSR
jgi:hypothetical protein